MRSFYLLLTFISFLLNVHINDFITIDIDHAEETNIKLSSFVRQIEYVSLETTKDCLINDFFYIYAADQYFLAVGAFEHIYKFDRKNGYFIKELSRRGNGPDEYLMTGLSKMFDYKRQILYVDCFTKWRGLDIQKEKYVEDIIKPYYRYEKEGRYQGDIVNPYPYKGYYVGYMNNTTGHIKEKVALFTKEGEVLKSFPNYNFFEVKTSEKMLSTGLFYEYKNDLYVLPKNDTVYQLKNENLYPYIAFEFTNNQSHVKYETQNLAGESYTYIKSDDNISVILVNETDRFVFFTLRQSDTYSLGYYDKRIKKTYRTPFESFDKVGFINDIDGLLKFNLKYLLSDGHMVSWMQPSELSELYESGKLKSLSIRGKEIAEKTQYDDNPIVVIATLK